MKSAQEIASIALLQLEAERAVLEAAEELKRREAHWRRIAQEILPAVMQEAEMTSFTLDNGFKVTVADDVSASITVAKREAAHEWMRANGFGGLIKTEVAVSFPRTQEEAARKFAERSAEEFGADRVDINEVVHPSTLKAWLRERLEQADELHPLPPLDLFGAVFFTVAKITPPKPTKQRKADHEAIE